MRKTQDLTTPHEPAALHELLKGAGIPVVTIRSEWSPAEEGVCLCSVIVFEEGFEPSGNTVLAEKIKEHLELPGIKGKTVAAPAGFDRETSLALHRRV